MRPSHDPLRRADRGIGALGRALAIGVPCVFLGLAGGALIPRTTRPIAAPAAAAEDAPGRQSEASSVTVVGPTSARLAEEDRAALRAMIHEELVAERPAPDAPAAALRAPAAQQADAPIAPEQLESYDGARVEVDRAIARGAWTSDDRARLRVSLAALPVETRIEITRPLLVAVNAGQVRFEGRGPLF
jgi:hypothetical protein